MFVRYDVEFFLEFYDLLVKFRIIYVIEIGFVRNLLKLWGKRKIWLWI